MRITVFGLRVGVAALPSKCSLMKSVHEGKEEGAPKAIFIEDLSFMRSPLFQHAWQL